MTTRERKSEIDSGDCYYYASGERVKLTPVKDYIAVSLDRVPNSKRFAKLNKLLSDPERELRRDLVLVRVSELDEWDKETRKSLEEANALTLLRLPYLRESCLLVQLKQSERQSLLQKAS